MKHIAVVGTGTIGLMLGGLLTHGGHDITLVSMFRREVTQQLNKQGVTVQMDECVIHIPVKAVYFQDIPPEEKYDIVFVTGRSNDTQTVMAGMKNHLADSGFVSSLQNGMNDEAIAASVGWDRIVPCVCFAGGQCPRPGYVVTHDGYFIIGEPKGGVSDRVRELGDILSCAKRVELSQNVLADRWRKMAEVCLTVPVATISGYSLFSHYEDRAVQRVFALLGAEVLAVQESCGFSGGTIMGLNRMEWASLARQADEDLEAKFRRMAKKARKAPPGQDSSLPVLAPVDAYTGDIRKGRELEIGYVNGYVIRKGESLGIAVNNNRKIVDIVMKLRQGICAATPENLERF